MWMDFPVYRAIVDLLPIQDNPRPTQESSICWKIYVKIITATAVYVLWATHLHHRTQHPPLPIYGNVAHIAWYIRKKGTSVENMTSLSDSALRRVILLELREGGPRKRDHVGFLMVYHLICIPNLCVPFISCFSSLWHHHICRHAYGDVTP
jgi:hypothetical protein